MMDRATARTRLDARFDRVRPLVGEIRPHRGWIRAIRDALGMSSRELGARMGVAQQAVSRIEQSELHETIRLETLRRTAEALDCDLVYLLVPRTSLEEAVTNQARKKAAQKLSSLAHHSRLEDQTVTDQDAAQQLEEIAGHLVDRRGLWSEVEAPR